MLTAREKSTKELVVYEIRSMKTPYVFQNWLWKGNWKVLLEYISWGNENENEVASILEWQYNERDKCL